MRSLAAARSAKPRRRWFESSRLMLSVLCVGNYFMPKLIKVMVVGLTVGMIVISTVSAFASCNMGGLKAGGGPCGAGLRKAPSAVSNATVLAAGPLKVHRIVEI